MLHLFTLYYILFCPDVCVSNTRISFLVHRTKYSWTSGDPSFSNMQSFGSRLLYVQNFSFCAFALLKAIQGIT